MDEFDEFEKGIKRELNKMRSQFEKLLNENKKMKQKLNEMDDEDLGEEFSINVDDKAPKAKPKSSKKSQDISYGIPQTGMTKQSSKIASTPEDLDELLEADTLARSVYQKLEPLGKVKIRVLAMQMGISVEKCKTAINRLIEVGGVVMDDNEMVESA